MGIPNSLWAELWALRDGLALCSQLQLEAVEVELDTENVFLFVLIELTPMVTFPPSLMIAGTF